MVSAHWSAVKKRFYASEFATKKDDKFCCKACEAVNVKLNCHHLTYESLGAETNDQLCLLCDECHSLVHSQFEGNLMYATEKVIADKHYLQKLLDYWPNTTTGNRQRCLHCNNLGWIETLAFGEKVGVKLP